ncbi:T9SS type A sorting domain-containing protein [Flavobacterium sp.]|uniref:T9SS type A sorting domain-containing protein n=1 Tax=Flavobacterium sp. TaxID=239 RepID=UPI003750514E
MKTKLLFRIIFLTFLIQKSFSQTYFPMLNNSSWIIGFSSLDGPQFVSIEQGVDFVIGSFTYKKFIDVDFQTEIYIREDIATKRVYRRINNSDVLMCDFSLQVGSTILLGNGNLYTVNHISSVNVNGGQRREFNLTDPTSTLSSAETWIEGVGNVQHPLRPSYELTGEPGYNINCSYQNNVNVYNIGLALGLSPIICPAPTLITENYNLKNQKFKIYPNPFSTETRLILEDGLYNVSFEIYNLLGEKVKQIENLDSNEVTIKSENLVDGIYLFVLKQNEKVVETKKIVIQN